MIDHNHILDVESLLKAMRTLGSENLQAELARIARRELMKYIPCKVKTPRLVTAVYGVLDFYKYDATCKAFHQHLTDVKAGRKPQLFSTDLFGPSNKIPLIRELRTFHDTKTGGLMGLLEAKCIIEQTFADWVKPHP